MTPELASVNVLLSGIFPPFLRRSPFTLQSFLALRFKSALKIEAMSRPRWNLQSQSQNRVLSAHLGRRRRRRRRRRLALWSEFSACRLPIWKATKEYLNQRGTKIRVFRALFGALSSHPFSPHFSPLFPLQPSRWG